MYDPFYKGPLATVKLVEEEAAKNSISIVKRFGESSSNIPMDGEQLKQVALNLLLNAMQAMPEGGNITVYTWEDSASFGFSVEDEGIGISDEEKEKIFEPFFSTKKEGTGLGLAVAKQLVEGMSGTIDITPGEEGSRFDVRIPNG